MNLFTPNLHARINIFRFSVLLPLILFFSCSREGNNEFEKYYEEYRVEGSFILYDLKKDIYTVYNPSQQDSPFSPASTFKICNSLIALETGVAADENFVIKWDGVINPNPDWNRDYNLKDAFKNSTVWYYQELARRTGRERIELWLNSCRYGNRDISGPIDYFWITGNLRITPMQQIAFLKSLYENKLPFSQRSMDITKKMMVKDFFSQYTLRSKTGWGYQDDTDIGWYIGYIEKKDNVYFFVNCIQCKDPNNENFVRARMDIAEKIMRDLKIL